MTRKFAALAVVIAAAFAVYLWRGSRQPLAVRAIMARAARAAESGGGGNVLARPLPASSPAVSDGDRKLLSDLKEIFASKNDNDPRLDTEFRNLTSAEKELLRQQYRALPPESLNERGTIVFLIGRELRTPEDFAFLTEVGNQPVCLSLGDCTKEAQASEESMHEEAAVSVTLTYPQRVALKSLENLLSRAQHSGGGDPTQLGMALNALGAMTGSPVSLIAQKAAELQSRYAHLRH